MGISARVDMKTHSIRKSVLNMVLVPLEQNTMTLVFPTTIPCNLGVLTSICLQCLHRSDLKSTRHATTFAVMLHSRSPEQRSPSAERVLRMKYWYRRWFHSDVL